MEATDMEAMATVSMVMATTAMAVTVTVIMATVITEAMGIIMDTEAMGITTETGMDTIIGIITTITGTTAIGMDMVDGGMAAGTATELARAGRGRQTDMSGCATKLPECFCEGLTAQQEL